MKRCVTQKPRGSRGRHRARKYRAGRVRHPPGCTDPNDASASPHQPGHENRGLAKTVALTRIAGALYPRGKRREESTTGGGGGESSSTIACCTLQAYSFWILNASIASVSEKAGRLRGVGTCCTQDEPTPFMKNRHFPPLNNDALISLRENRARSPSCIERARWGPAWLASLSFAFPFNVLSSVPIVPDNGVPAFHQDTAKSRNERRLGAEGQGGHGFLARYTDAGEHTPRAPPLRKRGIPVVGGGRGWQGL